MPANVRPARADDPEVADLLYESAQPYYDAYAGSRERARAMLEHVYARRGHSASYEVCRVAELDGRVAGVAALFPADDSDRLARRFLRLTLARIPPSHWLGVLRHLRASARVTPLPPRGTLYIDALAVQGLSRRRGVATALLEDAEATAAAAGLAAVTLDTGLENKAAQALYERRGFERREVREAPDARTARAVGGAGFVSYFKRV